MLHAECCEILVGKSSGAPHIAKIVVTGGREGGSMLREKGWGRWEGGGGEGKRVM